MLKTQVAAGTKRIDAVVTRRAGQKQIAQIDDIARDFEIGDDNGASEDGLVGEAR